MEIRKVLGLSTNHITKETFDWLDRDDDTGITIYPFSYGFFVFVGDLKYIGNAVVDEVDVRHDLPDDLLQCIILALKMDCQWIQFDTDAGETDLLPVYGY